MTIAQIEITALPANVDSRKALTKGHGSVRKSLVRKSDDSGNQRNYIAGISSGALHRDAHGDRMTEACIKSFQQQFVDKDLPLLVVHTDDTTLDVGILTHAEITKDGEWYTEYRLYDKHDVELGIPVANIEKANHIYNKLAGQGVFKKPSRFELSIQGGLDTENDVIKTPDGNDLNNVDLNGTALCFKGAYPQKGVTAVSKAFAQIRKASESEAPVPTAGLVEKGEFADALGQKHAQRDMLESAWDLESTLFQKEREIMEGGDPPETKKSRLTEVHAEFSQHRIALFESHNFGIPGEGPETTEDTSMPEPSTAPAPAGGGEQAPQQEVQNSDGATADQVLQQLAAGFQNLIEQARQQLAGGEPQGGAGDPAAVTNADVDAAVTKALANNGQMQALSPTAQAQVAEIIKSQLGGLSGLGEQFAVINEAFGITKDAYEPAPRQQSAPQSQGVAGSLDQSALVNVMKDALRELENEKGSGTGRPMSPYERFAKASAARRGGAA